MEERTTSTGAAAQGTPSGAETASGPGCFICNVVLPLMERCRSGVTSQHFRNSRIEFLKGIRSIIDQRIEHLSRHEPRQGTHVTLE